MVAQKTLFGLLLLMAASLCLGASEPIGEITLVIGEAQLARVDGAVQSVVRNMPILVGDRIETSVGGHVHIRFVDGGMVSVRPESRLVIESYQREAGGAAGAIKFKLDRGAVRSVTGAWGEANRERFRLNTPIAAIGVRGTDFVVQADQNQLRAAVVHGAIVVAPFGEGCRAELLGPCATNQAAMLAADMGNVMLEMRRQDAAPRIVPLSDLKVSSIPAHSEDQGRRVTPAAGGQDSVTESRAGKIISEQVVSGPSVAPSSDLLVWGRWGALREGDTMSVSQADAQAAGARRIAITSPDGYYMLYRTNGNAANFPASLGQVQFGFASGQASLMRAGETLPVTVRGGTLGINFATGQFSTELSMSQQRLGTFGMSASGTVNQRGVLLYRGVDGAYITGALSVDGDRAAYTFGKQMEQGMVSGIANWGRR